MITDPLRPLKPPRGLKGWSQSSLQDGIRPSTPFYLWHTFHPARDSSSELGPGLTGYVPSSMPLLTLALPLIPPLPTRPTSDHLFQEVSSDSPGQCSPWISTHCLGGVFTFPFPGEFPHLACTLKAQSDPSFL